jgi:hypothetical protein
MLELNLGAKDEALMKLSLKERIELLEKDTKAFELTRTPYLIY